MTTLIGIISIIAAILQIILFFKIWRMTNDVRELKNHFIDEERNNDKEHCSFNIGDKVIYEHRKFEVLEILTHGLCKCRR